VGWRWCARAGQGGTVCSGPRRGFGHRPAALPRAACGHLVALRDDDLAYLHIHPDGSPGDGRTAGPEIIFLRRRAQHRAYRLHLDFQHNGTVRTAEFTALAGGASPANPDPVRPSPSGHDDQPHSRGYGGFDMSGTTTGKITDLPTVAIPIELTISGMTCASCASRIAMNLNRMNGVIATGNYATEQVTVASTSPSCGVAIVAPHPLEAVATAMGGRARSGRRGRPVARGRAHRVSPWHG
jgi:copper chaperone CopZ